VGLVPQDLALYEELSAWANLQLFGGLYGLGAAELEPRAKAALALVGLADRSTDRVKTFSGGMKRRLNIAGALLHEPDLILLDEPTVGVDPQSRSAIFDNLEELKRRGKTLLYTTHYMEEAERLCDRVMILDHGQILANDTVAHFKQQYANLEAAFMQLTGRALRDGAEA
jgi:ABC-2 type transport system ATP-binding protein